MWNYFIFVLFAITANGKRFLFPSPLPRYPDALRWPILPEDLGDASKTDAYGLPWEQSGLFQGDIVTSPADLRNTLSAPERKWTLPVPVFINGSDFDDEQLSVIEEALTEIEAKTCVRFRQYQAQDEYFVVVRGHDKGCWSMVGRRPGGQILHLQVPQCVQHGVVVHEFLHALGLHHQQSSPDRDDYVQIHWENIKQGREYNFNKYSRAIVTTFNLTYDYNSVMHYSEKAFSYNGSPTITPLKADVKIGQRKGMSVLDATKVQYLYDCPVKPVPEPGTDTDEEYFDLGLEF